MAVTLSQLLLGSPDPLVAGVRRPPAVAEVALGYSKRRAYLLLSGPACPQGQVDRLEPADAPALCF